VQDSFESVESYLFGCCCVVDVSSDVDQCCKDGLKEAESCCDVEMQAEFLYCGAILALMNQKPMSKVLLILQVCVQVLLLLSLGRGFDCSPY